jgi:hypothetical protein
MSSNKPQAEKPTDELLAAVAAACSEKLERSISPTTTIRARDACRIMDADHDVTDVGVALGWLEQEATVADRGFSMTIEPNGGQKHRMRYRLAEAGDGNA